MMKPSSQVSYRWRESTAASPYATGVSLHSHTSVSKESLRFLHKMGTDIPCLTTLLNFYQRACRERNGIEFDFDAAHWRPPLQPRMAYDLEHGQLQRLGLTPLISITDHDSVEAPMLLRAVASARHIPVSVEWTAPFGETVFHLGIHNLPSAEGYAWMARFSEFTESPSDSKLLSMLRELHATSQVLTILNHPLWDLHSIGRERHEAEVRRILRESGDAIHAIELNGLRHARENQAVRVLAADTKQLLISGGDRHSLEPNANINLTNAKSFGEFVQEIRVERRSHVLFLDQYARPWEQRIVHSTLDAVSDFPHFIPGWQRWDQRAFHPDAEGVMRPLSELWTNGRAPLALLAAIRLVRLARNHVVARPLGLAFNGVNELETDLEAA